MEEIRFDQRVAVVTGGGRGLGRAYAMLLARRGCKVIVHDAGVAPDGTDADTAIADAVVRSITDAGGEAVACHADMTADGAVEDVMSLAIEHFGRVDILIHNAGLLHYAGIEAMPDDLFERMLAVHVSAPYRLTQAAWSAMREQRFGRIVFTTSGRALLKSAAQAGLSAYAAGKAAAIGLMHALAAEGEPYGIRVNAISPVAATRMLQRDVAADRFVAEQVAPAVAYLASAECQVTGMTIRAQDGGFALGRWTFDDSAALGDGRPSPEDVCRWVTSTH